MPEPTSSAAATLVGQALAVPALTVAGISLGVRPDVLLAGFCGAVAAIGLLNTVPSTGDTLLELVRTSVRRVGVTVGSAVTAGYIAPLLNVVNGVPDWLVLSVGFVAGAGAPKILPWLIERLGLGQGAKPPPPSGPGDPPANGGGWNGMRGGDR
jgi:hypothetical protein